MLEKEAVARWSSNELAASFSLRNADDTHGVELNVHRTGKRVCGRLRQPGKNNDGWDQQTRLRCSFNKLTAGKAGGAGI